MNLSKDRARWFNSITAIVEISNELLKGADRDSYDWEVIERLFAQLFIDRRINNIRRHHEYLQRGIEGRFPVLTMDALVEYEEAISHYFLSSWMGEIRFKVDSRLKNEWKILE